MKATIKIVSGQGRPIYPQPHRDIPDSVAPQTGGAIFAGRAMTDTVSFAPGMETYQAKHSPKWQEANPISARADGHGYAGTGAANHTIPQVTLYARDMDVKPLVGAQRLHQLLDWLTFCVYPWTKHGMPPLLLVTVGRRYFYGVLDGFDPQITEFMPDDNAGKQTGLPYSVTFGLSFKEEALGLQALETRADRLPKSVGLQGGAGGFVKPGVIPTVTSPNTGAARGAAQTVSTLASGITSGGKGVSVSNFAGNLGSTLGGLLTRK